MNIIHIQYPHDIPKNAERIVLAIGFFDGIHLGHQEVILTAKQAAVEQGIPCAVMTFNPHPREVLGKQSFPYALTPMNEKKRLLKQMGVDYLYIVHFDKTFAAISPQQFIDEVLVSLNVNCVVVGFNYTFGHKGLGTIQHLHQFSNNRYSLKVVDPKTIEGDQVSSTLIREKLLNGQVENVSRLLGRHYLIRGTVVHGEGRGKKLGFPTANMQLSDPYFIPKTGVYAVRVTYDNRLFDGVMNIGFKPTFHNDNKEASFEVHLLDEAIDLYGHELKIEFISFLRSEKKFSGIDELITQIKLDCLKAKEHLTEWKIK